MAQMANLLMTFHFKEGYMNTIKDIIQSENYDPLNEDMTYYKELQEMIPKNNEEYKFLTPNELEKCAMLFQGAVYSLNELKARVGIYAAQCKAQREDKLAFLKGKADIGKSKDSEALRERLAMQEQEWKDLRDKRIAARVIVDYVDGLIRAFYGSHYLCKGLLETLSSEEKINRFEGDPNKVTVGEKSEVEKASEEELDDNFPF